MNVTPEIYIEGSFFNIFLACNYYHGTVIVVLTKNINDDYDLCEIVDVLRFVYTKEDPFVSSSEEYTNAIINSVISNFFRYNDTETYVKENYHEVIKHGLARSVKHCFPKYINLGQKCCSNFCKILFPD